MRETTRDRRALQVTYDLIVSFLHPETLPCVDPYLFILNTVLSTSLNSFSALPGACLMGSSNFFSIASSFFSTAEPASSVCSAFSATSSAAGAPGFVSSSDMLQIICVICRGAGRFGRIRIRDARGSSPTQLSPQMPLSRGSAPDHRCGGKGAFFQYLIGRRTSVFLDFDNDRW